MGFFNDFDNIFDRMWNNFTRPVKDMYPYTAYKTDNGFIIVCNTLGIDKKDISVGIEKEAGCPFPILKIRGKTSLEKIDFENTVDLGIQLRFKAPVTSIKYDVRNGLTTVYLKVVEPDIPEIVAEPIDDDDDFDW